MVGGLPCVVIHVKCDSNRLRDYGAVGGRKLLFPISLTSGLYNSLYYRTVQAVTRRDQKPDVKENLDKPKGRWQKLREDVSPITKSPIDQKPDCQKGEKSKRRVNLLSTIRQSVGPQTKNQSAGNQSVDLFVHKHCKITVNVLREQDEQCSRGAPIAALNKHNNAKRFADRYWNTQHTKTKQSTPHGFTAS